nr:hypothetical protein [Streptomyces venezuelae]
MARIRTIKPEAFVSESLAVVTLTAERTFFGMLTQADDQGRHRDHAAIIAGQLWVLRPDHTPADVEDDLAQLADAGLICRYQGPDHKRYLHIVTWREHQKINRPSKSRLPGCPHHDSSTGAMPIVAEGTQWVSRRTPEIRLPIDRLGRTSETGIPYLAPEVQLFYKAKATRDKDETDFEAVLPLLDAPARAWLAGALKVIAPTHHWLRRLLPVSRT